MRGAAAALALAATASAAQTIESARFTDPTRRYAHAILGDAVEWGGMDIKVRVNSKTGSNGKDLKTYVIYDLTLPQDHVFEDVSPRLWDVTGDGKPEVVVVETDVTAGAALAIYGAWGTKIAETSHIGQSNRWLAPVGAWDLDGDGHVEIAYVDRPHLRKMLRVFRYRDGALSEVWQLSGVTNHRIGEPDIAGGIRTCAGGPEMIVANSDWSRLLAVTLGADGLVARDIGAHRDRQSFARAMACK